MRQIFAWLAGVVIALQSAMVVAETEYPKLKLRMAHFLPANFPGPIVDQWFADEVKKRSDGNITIQIFWAGSLGRATEMLDMVASGSVELATTNPGYFPNEMPLFSIFQGIPFVFDSHEQAVEVTHNLYQNNEALIDEMTRNRVKPIFWHGLDGYRPLCTSKIEKTADFEGMRMRGFGEYYPLMWSAIGATSVNVLPAELYEGLMRSTIDCAFWAYDSLHAGKLYEVAKYTTDIDFGAQVNYPLVVSLRHWDKWPQSVKDLFMEVGAEAMQQDNLVVAQKVKESRDDMINNHDVEEVTFADADALQAAIPDIQKVWLENMVAQGLGEPAEQILQTIRDAK